MRWIVRLVLPLAVVAVFAAGLLPPLVARGQLATDTVDAARAASVVAATSDSRQAIQAAAAKSISGHAGVELVSVNVLQGELGATVQVTAREHVHTFMEGFLGLRSWFTIQSTQESTLGQ